MCGQSVESNFKGTQNRLLSNFIAQIGFQRLGVLSLILSLYTFSKMVFGDTEGLDYAGFFSGIEFKAFFAFSITEFMIDVAKQEVTIPAVLGIGYLVYNLRSAAARTNFKRVIKENIRFSWTEQTGFREVLIFIAFLVFYKISRFVAIGDETTAFANAYRVVEWEKMLGIFNEISVQQFFMDKQSLIEFLNQIYLRVHVPSTVIFFVWLYHWHKNYYFYVRNAFMMANVITIFFFIGYPCAPPAKRFGFY